MKKTTIYLPEELMIEIKIVSKQDRRSEAEIIREALGEYLTQRRRPWPRSFGMVADGSFNAADDEAYLEEHWKPDW
jgi:metal-responsive CopG/Arc/MetJ family transcriptional regulator